MQNCPWRRHLLELLDDTVGRVYDDKLRELEDIYNDMVLDYPNPSYQPEHFRMCQVTY
jgi:hypothetical protein